MSEEGQKFLEALHEYLAPFLGAAATAAVGYVAGRRKTNAESAKLESEAGAIPLDAVTRSFQALIDGYEKRIEDLTDEVNALRDEVRALRQSLDKRPRC